MLKLTLTKKHETELAKHMYWPAPLNFWLAHHAPILLKTLIGLLLLTLAKLHPSVILINIGLINGSVDRAVLSNSQVRTLLNLNIQDAFHQGTTGTAQDVQLCTQPWGFQLTKITATRGNLAWRCGSTDTPVTRAIYLRPVA